MTGSQSLDWGIGSYERTADQLMPAAHALVESAAPAQGERVIDVGCGTGNAALLAAQRGAHVTGVDPAERLLEVARGRAREQGLSAEFVPGEAASLPVGDGEVELVLSVFGLIFAPDAQAAAAELERVTAPGGRLVFSAWLPGGAIATANRLAREATSVALGSPPAPPPFAWHERGALEELLGPRGFRVSLEERPISFTGPTAAEYLDAELSTHPVAVAGARVLEPRGELDALRTRMLEVLERENEDPDAFRVTSRYVIVTASRS
ncbi:MAG TPA: class I SAM-dependent methyltransferase [Thermoleophilaceae bacterium]